jgi:exodeoxyribonuclease VII small subunit
VTAETGAARSPQRPGRGPAAQATPAKSQPAQQPSPEKPGPGQAGKEKPGQGQAAQGSDGQIPYEQARDQLTEVVKRLEAGGLTLEQSLELWERGERLAAICEEWLEGARARLAAAMTDRTADTADPSAPF